MCGSTSTLFRSGGSGSSSRRNDRIRSELHRMTSGVGSHPIRMGILRAARKVGLMLWMVGSVPIGVEAAQQIVTLASAEAEPYRVALRGFQEAISLTQQGVEIHEYFLKEGSERERLLAEIRQRRPSLVLTL